MPDWLISAWPLIVGIAGFAAAAVLFMRHLLTVRKLTLEITQLKRTQEEVERRILLPTASEVKKYGQQLRQVSAALETHEQVLSRVVEAEGTLANSLLRQQDVIQAKLDAGEKALASVRDRFVDFDATARELNERLRSIEVPPDLIQKKLESINVPPDVLREKLERLELPPQLLRHKLEAIDIPPGLVRELIEQALITPALVAGQQIATALEDLSMRIESTPDPKALLHEGLDRAIQPAAESGTQLSKSLSTLTSEIESLATIVSRHSRSLTEALDGSSEPAEPQEEREGQRSRPERDHD